MASPDYQRIADLERELGIGQPEREPGTPRPRPAPVCLVKHCNGETQGITTWAGVPLRYIHFHEH